MIFDSHGRGLARIPRENPGMGARPRFRGEIAQARARPADTARMARKLLALITLISLLMIAAPGASHACRYAGKAGPEVGDSAARKAVTCVINKARKKRGLKRVRANAKLVQAASAHSYDMVMNGYFSHISPGGDSAITRARQTGYMSGARAWGIGEALGWGGGKAASPKRVVRGWLRSAGHRQIILSRGWRHIGVGVMLGSPGSPGSYATTYTASFGFRR